MEMSARGFGDNLNAWFRSLGRNWKPLLILSVISHLLVGVIVVVIFSLADAAEWWAVLVDPDLGDTLTDREILESMIPFAWILGPWMLVQLAAAVFVYLATARIVALEHAGRDESWADTAGVAWRRFGVALSSSLLVLVLALIWVGVLVAVAWAIVDSLSLTFLTVFLVMVLSLTTLVVMAWLGVSVALSPQSSAWSGQDR